MTIECPVCSATAVRREKEIERFPYGQGKGAVTLEALVPVYTCESCEFRYTDHEAEGLRHEAVCRHLQIMTPAELQKIRSDLGMSREELADISGLGVASLARWESGANIQNKANDNYLFLLSFTENRQRILSRGLEFAVTKSTKVVSLDARRKVLRGLGGDLSNVSPEMLERSQEFRLRKVR